MKLEQRIQELQDIFENSFVNEINELILVPDTNLYFKLSNIKTEEDLIYKIMAWCSRDASKTNPYDTERENERYREMVRDKLNYFLNITWTEREWFEIYSNYGNGIQEEECRKMIRDNFIGK